MLVPNGGFLVSARGLLLAGIVATTGSDCEFAIPASPRFHMYGAISSDRLWSRWFVADGVLIADVARPRGADGIDFVERAGKEGNASGALGDGLQRPARAALSLFPQESDGVDRGPIFFLQSSHCLLQRFAAGIILAIGDDEQDLLLQFAVPFQLVRGSYDRIVQSRSAASFISFQGFLQQIDLVGKGLIEEVLIAEVDHEDFILGIAGADQIDRSFGHFCWLLAHGPRIADTEPQRNRNILVAEGVDDLELAVLENGKSVLVEAGNHALFAVNHSGVQDDFLHFRMKHEPAVFDAGLLALGRSGRRRWRCGLRAAGRCRRRSRSLSPAGDAQ